MTLMASPSTNSGPLGKLRRSVATGVARRLELTRDESGQALIVALLLILLISILIPVLGTQLNADTAATGKSASSEAALAAAEAGVQEYRNYLDNLPSYYTYNYGNTGTPPDTALSGWKQVGSTDESFHYVPDQSRLSQSSGGSAGQMLLEVTGRAGTQGNYQYRTLLVSYELSGILTDSYYSEYELSDPNEPGVLPNVTVTPAAGSPSSVPMNQVQVEYTYTDQHGNSTMFGPMALSDAVCKYHTYDENTFIDSLGTVVNNWANGGGSPASAANPYYGPYYDKTSITYNVPNNPGWPNAGATISIPGSNRPCSVFGIGIYDGTVAFNGSAYTNDQFWLAGNPQFNGSPPLASGAPAGGTVAGTFIPWSYRDNWQGAVKEVIKGVTYYVPQGWVDDFYDGQGGTPIWGATASPKGATLGGSQHLPTTTAGLISYVDGTKENGCLYTGPTMIEFVKGGTMNVWSPLSENTEPNFTTGTKANCGTFSLAAPWQSIPVPSSSVANNQSGVIYVQSEQSPGNPNSGHQTAPPVAPFITSGALPSGATCLNPYYWNLAANSPQCTEGDAIVEGELRGQVTLSTSASIMVSRDLTYQCADGAGGATDANPSSIAACNAVGTNDVLGLLSNQDLIVAHPNGGSNICPDDGTGSTQAISNVVPWSCDIKNTYADGGSGVVIDAAAVTLTGSTYLQNFTNGANLGNLYQNGTNINYYPGFNGVSGGAGYSQELSYDTRLSYLNPPHLLQATDTVWNVTGFVVCGTINSASFPVVSGAQAINCPSIP